MKSTTLMLVVAAHIAAIGVAVSITNRLIRVAGEHEIKVDKQMDTEKVEPVISKEKQAAIKKLKFLENYPLAFWEEYLDYLDQFDGEIDKQTLLSAINKTIEELKQLEQSSPNGE